MSSIELPEFTTNLGAGPACGESTAGPLAQPRFAISRDRDRLYLRLYDGILRAIQIQRRFHHAELHDQRRRRLAVGPRASQRRSIIKLREGKNQPPSHLHAAQCPTAYPRPCPHGPVA